METIMNLPEVREIEETRSKFLTMALSTKVSDQKTLTFANELFLEADANIKAVDEKLDPKRELAYRAYQEWLKLIKELKEPYLKGKTYINNQIVIYKKEQDRIRDEEMERQRQEAIKIEMDRRWKEEEDRISQAIALEEVGAHEEAESLISETIEDKEKPIEVYTAPASTPKVILTGATVKEYWHAEVTDLRALCKAIGEGKYPTAYVKANMGPLNDQARDLKKEFNIPGVKAVSMSSMAATGR